MDDVKINLIGHDNVLMRSYIYFLKESKCDISIVLLPKFNKKNKKLNKITQINKSNSLENYFSKLHLKIPRRFWNDENINNLLLKYFQKNYGININSFNNLLSKDLRDINKINNIEFLYAKKFNLTSLEDINFSSYEGIFLNTSSFIYTEKLIRNLNNNIYHVHPGYLPELKGADGIFWSIKNYNKIGMSLFKMNENIDEGNIYFRKYFDFIKFENDELYNLGSKDKYNFILSTLDPILRGYFFSIFGIKSFTKLDLINNYPGNYNTFMTGDELESTFKIIFRKKV